MNAERRAASGTQRAQRSALANDAELALRIVDRLAQKRGKSVVFACVLRPPARLGRRPARVDPRRTLRRGWRQHPVDAIPPSLKRWRRTLRVPASSNACRRCRAGSRSAGPGEAPPAALAAAGSKCRRRHPPEATPAIRNVRCRTRRARRPVPKSRRFACRRAACRQGPYTSERHSRRGARAARSPTL